MTDQSPAEDLREQLTSILLVFGADYSNASNADDVNWKAEALSEARLPIMELVTTYAATVEREARIDQAKFLQEAQRRFGSIDFEAALYELQDRDRLAALQGPQDGDVE